jgi:2-hydroxycyclohexanecarboxyl-CoA dehydrogenase
MRGLKGKTVIVTGGGGGIGDAACRRFAEEGAKVAVFDINKKAADATVAAIVAAKGEAKAFVCDITDYAGVQAAVNEVRAAFGPIDILVNNAGWDVFRPFLQTTPADWQKLIAINFVGTLNMHHVVLPEMIERRSGRVVNVASDAGRVGSSGEAVYASCKGAMIALTKTLARETATKGISVNVVCPGPTETPLLTDVVATANNPEKLQEAFRRAVPMGRLGVPGDLPGAICFFASDDAGYITGQVLSVSGGLTMAG